jgi:hypothetical protein
MVALRRYCRAQESSRQSPNVLTAHSIGICYVQAFHCYMKMQSTLTFLSHRDSAYIKLASLSWSRFCSVGADVGSNAAQH